MGQAALVPAVRSLARVSPRTELAQRAPLSFSRARAGAWLHGVPSRRILFALAGVGAAASVTLAAPLSAASLSAALALGAMLVPRPLRGHRALVRAVALHRRDSEAGSLALRELLGKRSAHAVRLEAAGRLALAALERGQLHEAVAPLADAESDVLRVERPSRGLGLGLLGELMRSMLSRLGVSRFTRVAESSALAPGSPQAPADERDREEYMALLSMLELLEAEAGAPLSVLEAAWRRMRATHLAERFAGLSLIADAAVARRLPAARSAIEQVFEQRERARWARSLLDGLFPSLLDEIGLGEQGYRRPGHGSRALVAMDSYQPPAEILELVEAHDRGELVGRFGTAVSLAAGPVGALAMSLSGVGAFALLLGAAGLSGNLERSLRAGPLLAMPYGPRRAWLRELAAAPDAPAPLGDRHAPLRSDALALYLCCIRAEQALAKGEPAQAWDWIAWWFADRDNRRGPKLSLYPVASSLLRVACLSNHMVEARSLAELLEPGPAQRFGLRRRTVHGDAPRALALAKALVYGRAGAWSEAARALEKVAGEPGVIMSERDEVLYALMAQKVAGMIPKVDPRLCAVSPRSVERVRPFLVRVWPQLISYF